MVWPQHGPWLPGYILESPGWQGRSGGLRHQRGQSPLWWTCLTLICSYFRGKSGKLSQVLLKHKSSLFPRCNFLLFSVIWAIRMLPLMLGDSTSDFKLRPPPNPLFSPPYIYYCCCTHMQKPLEVCQLTAKNTNNKQSIKIRHNPSHSNTMAIFFFYIFDRLNTQEGKCRSFPLGES